MDQGSNLDMGKWKGLFEWSMRYQDGTHAPEGVKELTPEKQQFLEAALSEFMVDFADRMKEITTALASGEENKQQQQQQQPGSEQQQAAAGEAAAVGGAAPLSLADREALCDELLELVESIDHARDLHKIGGLPTLLELMASPHASLRWRAAEIAATCMANNPPVQRWFMAGGAAQPLLALLGDPDPRVATKALLALSALARHYQPGLEELRRAGGLAKLCALLGCTTDAGVASADASLQQATPSAAAAAAAGNGSDGDSQQQQQQQWRRLERKALALLQYVLLVHPGDAAAAAEAGLPRQLGLLLADSPADSDMRQAVLGVLVELAAQPSGWAWVRQHTPGLVPQLQQLLEQHRRLPQDEAEAEAEEGELLQRLLALLQSDTAPVPAAGAAGGLDDHIEVDPYLDGERAEKTLSIREPEGQQQAAGEESAAAGAGSAASGGLALMAVPQPDLR